MQVLLKNGTIFTGSGFVSADVLISDGNIVSVSPSISISGFNGCIIDCNRFFIAPSFADIHVHLREPGFSYKATVRSETAAAAKGGYTAVCAMPNLKPSPDSLENLKEELDIIKRDALIDVFPYGTMTVGSKGEELSDMEAMAPFVFAFSDDGKGVQKTEMMKKAIAEAIRLNKPISAHCEVEALLSGGSVHEGEWAHRQGKKGISSESEWKMIERDLELLKGTPLRYNVCHISTKESVELIRKAKKEGLNVTAETAPHYLTMTDSDLLDEGRFKMNPPIRGKEDREALVEGFIDGTIDYLATDHAPHSKEEKEGNLEESLFGIVGLETAFAVVYTELVKTGKMSLETLIERMAIDPKKFIGLDYEIKEGKRADLVVLNLSEEWKIKGEEFVSAGKFTPFEGKSVFGAVEITINNGRIVWQKNGQRS